MGVLPGAGVPIRMASEALALTFRDPSLRRAQAAFAIVWAGEWAVLVALGVVAFDAGGPVAVGLVAALRMLPGALLAPLAATVADAVRRERVLIAIGVIRAVTLSAAGAVLALDGPVAATFGLVTLATVAQTLYRPAHSALLPALCDGPRELTSANVVRGLLDSFATLSGPLAAAVVLETSGPALVFVACGSCSLWASLLLLGLRYQTGPPPDRPPLGGHAVLDGFRAIGADRDLRLVTGLTTVQTFTRGAFSVLAVVVAIELLETGAAGVGILNGAVGAGAVLGSLAALMLVRHGRLAVWLGAGVALWGLPLAAIAAVPGELGNGGDRCERQAPQGDTRPEPDGQPAVPDEHERGERAEDRAGADRTVEDADAGRAGLEQLDRDDDGQHAEGSAREGLHGREPGDEAQVAIGADRAEPVKHRMAT